MEAFNSRLSLLEQHAQMTERRLDGLDTKLDRVLSVVTAQEAGKGPGLQDMIRTGSSLVTAGAVMAGLFIWVITSVMAGPVTTLTERQTVMGEAAKERSADLERMREELIVSRERLRVVIERLDGGEFAKNWQTRLAAVQR